MDSQIRILSQRRGAELDERGGKLDISGEPDAPASCQRSPKGVHTCLHRVLGLPRIAQ